MPHRPGLARPKDWVASGRQRVGVSESRQTRYMHQGQAWQDGGWDRALDRDRGEVVRGLARRCAIDGVPFVLRHAPGHLEAKDIRGECLLTLRVTCGS